MPANPLRRKLKDGQTTCGLWVTLESPNVTEAAVALQLDWVVIDMEHGHLHWGDVIDHLRVLRGTATAGLIRVPESRRETIQRSLDLGAHGIILPMIGSARELEQAMSWGRYPPEGVRGVGGERCVTWGLAATEYLQSANAETMLIPLLETRDAVQQFDAILAVAGLEAIFFGPADLSASHGYLGQWEGGDVAATIQRMRAQANARGIASGVLARDPDEAAQRRAQGFRMIGAGADMNLMIRSIRQTLAALHDPT